MRLRLSPRRRGALCRRRRTAGRDTRVMLAAGVLLAHLADEYPVVLKFIDADLVPCDVVCDDEQHARDALQHLIVEGGWDLIALEAMQ